MMISKNNMGTTMKYVIIIALLMSAHPGHAMDQLPEIPEKLGFRDSDDQGNFKADNDEDADDQDVQHIAKKTRFSCPEPGCDHTFASKHGLRVHQQNHKATLEEQKPHVCGTGECPKRFAHTRARNRHRDTCTGQIAYACTIKSCNKFFAQDNDRINHERMHHGNPEHECRLCGLVVTRARSLGIHERIHTGEKPYQCRFCKQEFGRSDQCRNHEVKCEGNLLITLNSDAQNNSIDD
jgi:uncharacterized Zn-finger protein